MSDHHDPVSVPDISGRFFLYLILAALLTGAIVRTVRKRNPAPEKLPQEGEVIPKTSCRCPSCGENRASIIFLVMS